MADDDNSTTAAMAHAIHVFVSRWGFATASDVRLELEGFLNDTAIKFPQEERCKLMAMGEMCGCVDVWV